MAKKKKKEKMYHQDICDCLYHLEKLHHRLYLSYCFINTWTMNCTGDLLVEYIALNLKEHGNSLVWYIANKSYLDLLKRKLAKALLMHAE